MLNLAELLHCAPSSARNRSPVYLLWRAPNCQSWDGADTQPSGPGGSSHIDYSKTSAPPHSRHVSGGIRGGETNQPQTIYFLYSFEIEALC